MEHIFVVIFYRKGKPSHTESCKNLITID